MKECLYWEIVPAHDITVGSWIFKKTKHIDRCARFDGLVDWDYTIDAFTLQHTDKIIIWDIIYEKPYVNICMTGWWYDTMYFSTDVEATAFYNEVIYHIWHKISYA